MEYLLISLGTMLHKPVGVNLKSKSYDSHFVALLMFAEARETLKLDDDRTDCPGCWRLGASTSLSLDLYNNIAKHVWVDCQGSEGCWASTFKYT